MTSLSKRELIEEIVKDVENDVGDEEIIRLILERKVAVKEDKEEYTFGQKAADRLVKYVGSWAFVMAFLFVLICWMIVNGRMGKEAFDPYPFILLNLALSCLAAIQAPLIMMSQNRQEKKDRRRAENDYRVNLKSEIIIQDLYNKLDVIVENQLKTFSSDSEQQQAYADDA